MTADTRPAETIINISYESAEAPTSRSIWTLIEALRDRYRAHRQARLLASLSDETRRDIGLPPRSDPPYLTFWLR